MTDLRAKLYKSAPIIIRQSERRKQLLNDQKKHRQEVVDNLRGIHEIVENLRLSKSCRKKQTKKNYRNYVQLSEWMREKPDDLDNWYLVPCPQGNRCIVVASEGTTEVYNKYGVFQTRFRSALSGDKINRQNVTILDCIYVPDTQIYYVLDLIAYANQQFNHCDVTFRFFWITSKIQEEQLDQVTGQNEYAFKQLQFFDCANENAIADCLTHYPMWNENVPKLDGLLFYHKESSYVNGTTPLVTWLFPFMVPEMLDVPYVNAQYLSEAPTDYVNCSTYIEQFDATQKSKRKRRHRKPNDKMEADDDDIENEFDEVHITEMALELDGECIDDVHYKKMDV